MKRYIWPIYESFDIFKADTNGKIVKRLTNSKGYDAEATISPKGIKLYLRLCAMVTLICIPWILMEKM